MQLGRTVTDTVECAGDPCSFPVFKARRDLRDNNVAFEEPTETGPYVIDASEFGAIKFPSIADSRHCEKRHIASRSQASPLFRG